MLREVDERSHPVERLEFYEDEILNKYYFCDIDDGEAVYAVLYGLSALIEDGGVLTYIKNEGLPIYIHPVKNDNIDSDTFELFIHYCQPHLCKSRVFFDKIYLKM